MDSPTGSGFTLSNINPDILSQSAKYVGGRYGDLNSYLVTLIFKMNESLASNVSHIEMFLPDGFLFGYNVDRIRNGVWISTKKISPDLIGQTITVNFGKYIQQTESEMRHLRRAVLGKVYSTQITICEPKQYETEECPICMDIVNDVKNKYLSPCGHLFHLKCIFSYLQSTDKLYEVPRRCTEHCCLSQKIKPFSCPVCRQLIINSSLPSR